VDEDALDVAPKLQVDRCVEAVLAIELGDLNGVAFVPSTARASPPGINFARKKVIRITPRMTTNACPMRRTRKPIIEPLTLVGLSAATPRARSRTGTRGVVATVQLSCFGAPEAPLTTNPSRSASPPG